MSISLLLLNLIFVLLPSQLGLHFWPKFAFLSGQRIDYLSPTLYFTDILILSYLFATRKFLKINLKTKSSFLIISFVIINTVFSISPINTAFHWLRLLLYLTLCLSLKRQKIKPRLIAPSLILGLVYTIFLEIFQFKYQHQIGGPFYFLGERPISISTPNVAKINFAGLFLLRPYATFSHPNSLAGYLLLSLVFLNEVKIKISTTTLLILSIFLTFSKSAIFALISLFGRWPVNALKIIVILGVVIFLALPNSSKLPVYVQERLKPKEYLTSIIFTNPLFGIGYGSYLPALSKQMPGSLQTRQYLQPLHQVPLLMICELGIFGSLFVFCLTFKIINKKPGLIPLYAGIFIISSFDHYFWTLPQNLLSALLFTTLLL